MLDKRRAASLAGNPDRIEYGSPAGGKSAQRLAEATFGGACGSILQGSPELPAGVRASPLVLAASIGALPQLTFAIL